MGRRAEPGDLVRVAAPEPGGRGWFGTLVRYEDDGRLAVVERSRHDRVGVRMVPADRLTRKGKR